MSECIEWTKQRDRDGYGKRKFRGKKIGAHRAAWIEAHGEIPEGMMVLHHCDNPPCINVEHLFLGTHKDNMDDAYNKGRREGNTIVRPSKELAASVRELRIEGMSQAKIAAQLGTSQATVSRILLGVYYD